MSEIILYGFPVKYFSKKDFHILNIKKLVELHKTFHTFQTIVFYIVYTISETLNRIIPSFTATKMYRNKYYNFLALPEKDYVLF